MFIRLHVIEWNGGEPSYYPRLINMGHIYRVVPDDFGGVWLVGPGGNEAVKESLNEVEVLLNGWTDFETAG